MKINYKLENRSYSIIFCPDKEGLKIKKKIKSYTTIAKDLKLKYKKQKILLAVDKRIDHTVTKYLINDLKISFPKMSVMYLSGEKVNKNFKELKKLINFFFDKKFTKKSVLISCGGGVIGDLCGLASSLYLRGLIYYSIPSTMTAIVDSCIGGKTGINYRGVINSLGTYYHPEKVYISKNIFNLIPKKEYLAGIPEIIKCGLISKNSIINLLESRNKVIGRNFSFLSTIIKKALETKIKFFKDDVFENHKRLNLNFGHTFAHAIEMSLKSKNNKDQIRHGEAVGIGILCEIFYSNGKNKNFSRVKELLSLYGLPHNINHLVDKKTQNKIKKDIYQNIFLDKKTIKKNPRYIKFISIGKTNISEMKDYKLIKKTIDKVIFDTNE